MTTHARRFQRAAALSAHFVLAACGGSGATTDSATGADTSTGDTDAPTTGDPPGTSTGDTDAPTTGGSGDATAGDTDTPTTTAATTGPVECGALADCAGEACGSRSTASPGSVSLRTCPKGQKSPSRAPATARWRCATARAARRSRPTPPTCRTTASPAPTTPATASRPCTPRSRCRATPLGLPAGSTNAACAALSDGSAKCWGGNGVGQLGLGDTSARGDMAGEMGDALPRIRLFSDAW